MAKAGTTGATNKMVFDYNPKSKINIHESTVTLIND